MASVPDDHLTHYAEPIVMPADRVVRVHVKHTLRTCRWAQAEYGVAHAAIHVPPDVEHLKAAADAPAQHFQFINYPETARTLLFHHPDLINVDVTATHTIKGYMLNDPTISDLIETLAGKMRDMGPPTETSGWATLVPYAPPPNSDTKINPNNQTFYYTMPADDIQTAAGAAMTALMKVTKNDLTLQGKKWTLEMGVSVQPNISSQSEKATNLKAGDSTWQPALQNTGTISGLTAQIQVLDATNNQLQLTLSNNYIRYLGVYIRFFDACVNPISVPSWTPDGGGEPVASAMGIQYDDLRYVGHVGPQNNILAIPIPPAGGLKAGITFPKDAVSATIYGSGLGTGSDEWPLTPVVGGLLTGIVNLGIPTFLLAAGAAAQAFGPAYTIVDQLLKQTPFITGVLLPVIGLFSTFGTHGEMKMNWGALTGLFKVLFSKGATQLLLWMEEQIVADEIEEQIPFAGWIMVTINISLGVAQLAETMVEVALSPWNIENTISITVTTNVTLNPDPRHGAFPGQGVENGHYVVKMIYQNQTRPTRSDSHDVPSGNISKTLTASFPGNTLGGQVKFEADYYLGDWLAAKATTGWMNNDQTHVTQVNMWLVELPVALTNQSVYQHSALLTYQNDAYLWQSTATAPTETIANADTGSGNAISEWAGLTLSQRTGMIGFAWKAAGMGITSCVSGATVQLFAMQNVNIPGTPMNAVKFPNCGLDGQTMLVYDSYPPKFQMGEDGNWVLGPHGRPLPDPNSASLGNYYVDPRKADNPEEQDGGYHLRLVTLDDTTPFNLGTNLKSYARFRHQPDSIALHPSGHVVAVNTQHKRIQIGVLALEGANDEDLPLARVYAGEAQIQHRPGLLFHPVAVTCSYDGTILVLEDTKGGNPNSVVLARIQAFDLRGRPVNRFFDTGGNASSFLNLSTTGANTYLDIAAIGDQKMTYMYVLYYSGDGQAAADYHMAIYQYGKTIPKSNPLVTTDNLAAAKLAVDMWHTAYVLNYAMTTDGKGKPAGPSSGTNLGPAGRTVPSVSEWLPPVPKHL
ncbi:MAG TPA: hypothetical protein VH351_11900 [Bryobacteraceae bacterium]|nr:hypothetical protein [Bryobacteraceae bacterium]